MLTGALGAAVELLIGLDALLQKGIKDVASAFNLEEEIIQNYLKRFKTGNSNGYRTRNRQIMD